MIETIISIIFLLFSLSYLYFAEKLSFGTISDPKCGFLPVIAGIIAVLLSLTIVTIKLMKHRVKNSSEVNWLKFILIIIGLALYIIILNIFGYYASTFLIMLYLLKQSDTQGWFISFLLSAGTSLGFYILFEQLLSINLP